MKLNEINELAIRKLINNFIKNENQGRESKYILSDLYFSKEICCWIASITEKWTHTYPDMSDKLVTTIDEDYGEVFLGEKGIFNYVFDETGKNRLSKAWTGFLQDYSKKDSREK